MFETILLPTDGSEHAEKAAETGLELAKEHNAAVHIICVADTAPLGYLRLPGDAKSAEEAIQGQAETFVNRLADRADSTLEVTSTVLFGPPETKILDYGEEISADLIVMGTRGRGGVHRLAVGSVTDHVIRFGDIGVYVPKEGAIKNSGENIG